MAVEFWTISLMLIGRQKSHTLQYCTNPNVGKASLLERMDVTRDQ